MYEENCVGSVDGAEALCKAYKLVCVRRFPNRAVAALTEFAVFGECKANCGCDATLGKGD